MYQIPNSIKEAIQIYGELDVLLCIQNTVIELNKIGVSNAKRNR